MKGDSGVIEHLNKALKLELTTVNQYFLHARMFKDWGFNKIAKIEYEESIDEMKHADMLIDRILFLEGLPNVQDLGKVMIGETLKECLECDLKAEQKAHPVYKEAIAYCEEVRDYGSRDLLEVILKSEEEHIDFLETQLELIERIGEERYMQSMMGEQEAG
ncbi:MAG: bacterioferritin [Oceanicaulis sp.]|uniref:bacterioferritin n=1 Tax=Glycocaulis sp. TaxID=1969725 RepID=UPI0025BC073A|nr:bacterioferritin [Glycocaulis sp.]MCC5982242.1 bacterioferritin [Oceanicaulis sp.]MCH8520953.1 bacterioferritin [Glycocaulis sp.]